EEAALPTNLEPDDDGMFRERCEPNAPLHVDEQRFQVVVLILRRSRQPSLSPRTERSHEDRQLLARLGERVFGTMLAIDPSYGPDEGQRLQSFRKHGAGDSWYASANVIEAAAPTQELPRDKESPATA